MEGNKYREIKHCSPSSILKYLFNYKEWYNTYVLGESTDNNIYFEFGTAFHGLLEDFFNDVPKDGENIVDYTTRKYHELFNKWFIKNNGELHKFMDEEYCMDNFQDWTFKYFQDWVNQTKELERSLGTAKAFEKNSPSLCEIEMFNEELKLKGIVDAYYGKDKYNPVSRFLNINFLDEGLIEDYKTSKLHVNSNPTKYYLQLWIYALLWSKNNGRKVPNFVSVNYVKYSYKFFIPVNKRILSSIEKLIKDINSSIEQINEEPEKYSDKPPKKISFKEYLEDF